MRLFLLISLLLALQKSSGQNVLFYNVENLFDTIDDYQHFDREFLPDSPKEYGSIRYRLALRQTARALRLAMHSVKNEVDVIALCEVETGGVVQDLARHRALRNLGDWRVVHYDSPDFRGIDCAALINTKRVKLLDSDRFRYSNDSLKTRDALYLQLTRADSTLGHIAIVHFSSKRGGAEASEWKRTYELNAVRSMFDTCQAPVLICGDFNDFPSAPAYRRAIKEGWNAPELVKMREGSPTSGTYKYQGRWQYIDLGLSKNGAFNTSILALPMLLEEDTKWGGFKPRKRWQGTFFVNGYSDHLPVYFSNVAN